MRKQDHTEELTDYEREIMVLLCQEKKLHEIGRKFNISNKAVHHRIVKIQDKIGVRSTAGVIVYAVSNFIYQPKL